MVNEETLRLNCPECEFEMTPGDNGDWYCEMCGYSRAWGKWKHSDQPWNDSPHDKAWRQE